MKIKWTGKTEFLLLTNGKTYDVLSIEKDWYRIVDDAGEDYLYPPDGFIIVDYGRDNTIQKYKGDT